VTETSNIPSPKVLLVEDEFLLGIAITKLLTDMGFEPIGPARSLDEAKWLIEAQPELFAAVLDMDLGGQKIWPIARELTNQGVPFLLITENATTSELPNDLRSSKVLLKPFDQNALGKAIAKIIEQHERAIQHKRSNAC
jgi:DNA-binding NtrC family response regulator